MDKAYNALCKVSHLLNPDKWRTERMYKAFMENFSYLFLIYTKDLISLLSKVTIDHKLTGIQICMKALTISHLLFVDNTCKVDK